MRTCNACGTSNPAGFRFCGGCGAALAEQVCPACGSPNDASQRFCGQCGAALGSVPSVGAGVEDGSVAATADERRPQTAPPADAPGAAAARAELPAGSEPPVRRELREGGAGEERKLATVLFADVVDFTALAERSDPEEVAHTVDRAFRRLAEVVDDHGGTVDKYMGDSLMAVFGVPVAHVDDAERAVAAALAIREIRGELRFSIGVNTGEVLVTASADGRTTVIGDAVNVAARLEKLATAGEVLVGPLTAELAGARVVLREREATLLKGKSEPLPVHEALSLRGRDDALPGATAVPPLVGRDGELAFLTAVWARVVRDSRADVVLLVGEDGVGKSRLADELVARIGGGALTARSTYPAYGGFGGPRVASDLIDQLGESGDGDIDTRLRSLRGESRPELATLGAEALEREQLWAFRTLVERRARERPVLIVLDDIHRAGDRTLVFLSELLIRIVDAPVMVVLSGRSEPLDWLRRFPAATSLHLHQLGPGDAATLAGALVDEGPLARRSAEFLAKRSGGNPLHLRELVRLVQVRGGLVAAGTELRLAGGMALPPSLHAVLSARLDGLAPGEKAAIQTVALLGEGATADAVAAVGKDDAAGALSRLVGAGLLRQGDDGALEVADPLLREVAYESLPRTTRAERHRVAATVAAGVDIRARHLDLAATYAPEDPGLRAEAAAAMAAAGTTALDAHRLTDGIRMLGRAADLGHRDPATLLHLAQSLVSASRGEDAARVLSWLPPDLGDPALEADRVHIGAHFLDLGPMVEAFDEARRRWHELGRRDKEGWALVNKGSMLFTHGQHAGASQALTESLEVFPPSDRLGITGATGLLSILHPDDPHVESWLTEGLEYAEETGDRSRQRYQLVLLAWHHYLRRRLDGPQGVRPAVEYARRGAEISASIDDAEGELESLCIEASVRRLAGDLGGAELLGRVLELAGDEVVSSGALAQAVRFSLELASGQAPGLLCDRPPSPNPFALMGTMIEAEALFLAGRMAEARTRLESHGAAKERPVEGSLAIASVADGVVRGGVATLEGRLEDAAEVLESSLPFLDASRCGSVAACARALLGEVALVGRGDRPAATRLRDQAAAAVSGGVAGLIVLRLSALLGDTSRAQLDAEALRLRAPGVLVRLDELAAASR